MSGVGVGAPVRIHGYEEEPACPQGILAVRCDDVRRIA
jgi:hypothetical protein